MNATRVCVVGSANLDTIYRVGALPRPGETVPAESVRLSPGGKGANQAVAAARGGARVRFVGAVGDDAAAQQLRARLRHNGVDDTTLIDLPGPSGTATVIVDRGGENVIVVAAGANGQLVLDDRMVTAIADSDVVLLQLETPLPTVLAAARAAHAAGATVIINASPVGGDPAGLAELAALTDVLVVNETEAAAWNWPVPHRVVTRGADGADYLGGAGAFTVPAPAVTAIDTAGAGDTFAGVLAVGWRAGPATALRRACAAGALATLVPGTGDCAPDAVAIERFLAGDDAATVLTPPHGRR